MMYRLYRRPSIWQDLNNLQREMNRIMGQAPSNRRVAATFPAMNVLASDSGLLVTAELPGVKADDIDISVINERLTLSGNRAADEVDDGARYHRRERNFGKFSRTVQLPFPVDADKVDATFTNGVLNISLPQSEDSKPKKIPVKNA
jgi:HSP20 family protein